MSDVWRPMDEAYRDGRHLILRPREATGKNSIPKAKRWLGGLVAAWSQEEDHWEVQYDPAQLVGGTMTLSDSHWFTGWRLLPDALYEPEGA